ncbi:hypothetical protein DQ961_20315 [Salmonella bongori]|nr:hypothetical protein [Salmonella bongori]
MKMAAFYFFVLQFCNLLRQIDSFLRTKNLFYHLVLQLITLVAVIAYSTMFDHKLSYIYFISIML